MRGPHERILLSALRGLRPTGKFSADLIFWGSQIRFNGLPAVSEQRDLISSGLIHRGVWFRHLRRALRACRSLYSNYDFWVFMISDHGNEVQVRRRNFKSNPKIIGRMNQSPFGGWSVGKTGVKNLDLFNVTRSIKRISVMLWQTCFYIYNTQSSIIHSHLVTSKCTSVICQGEGSCKKSVMLREVTMVHLSELVAW